MVDLAARRRAASSAAGRAAANALPGHAHESVDTPSAPTNVLRESLSDMARAPWTVNESIMSKTTFWLGRGNGSCIDDS